jgi:NAD(P)-dependent dehydrogenase (short-subunit alcohol dehydrogenase family)
MRFAGKVAVVTGAAGGLGRRYAASLAREGARVVGVDRLAEGLQRTGEAVEAAGGAWRAVVSDLADPTGAEAVVGTALDAFGRLDILVNNAGGGSSGPDAASSVAEETLESWRSLVDSNLTSAFLCIRAAAKPMKRQRYGKIVNVASRAARIADPNVQQSPAYAAAKSAVLGLTRFAARELGPYGITVNAVAPSLTLSGPVLEAYWNRMSPEDQDRYLRQVALRRLPDPEEVVAAVLFLCSDDSSYVTGVCLDVNGGSFMAP